MILASTHLGNLSYIVGICGFVVLTGSSIAAPFVASKKNAKALGSPNGSVKGEGTDARTYKDYNLYDLTMQSLLNSEAAKETAAQAIIVAGTAAEDIKKVMTHLGIE